MSSPPTNGADIDITNLRGDEVTSVNWNIATLTATIIDSTGTSTPATITNRGTTSIKVTVPPGYKRFTMALDDTKGKKYSQYVHYQLPYVSTLYARGYTVGSAVTLTGGNFGTTPVDLSITIAGATCTGYTVVESYTTVACNLAVATTSTLSLLPITIGYGANNYVASYRNNVPFYDFNTLTVIRACVDCLGTINDVYNWMDQSPAIDNNVAYMAAVINSAQSNAIVSNYNIGTKKLCEGLTSGFSDITYLATGGPYDDVVAYSPISTCLPAAVYCPGDKMSGSTALVAFGQELGVGKQYSITDGNALLGEFIYFGGFKPTQAAAVTIKLDTVGGTVAFTAGGSVGFKFTQRSFVFNSVTYTYPNVYQTSMTGLSLLIPEGTGTNNLVTVNIESYSLTNLKISYNPPTITKILPALTSIPGKVTLTGTNYGSSAGSITAKITLGASTTNTVTCRIVTAHYTLECDLPGGFGTQTFTLTVGGQSATYSYTYLAPVITQPTNNADILVITGTGLGVLPTDTIVSIPTVSGTATLTTVSDPQTYTAKIVTTTKNGPISVTVGGQTSNTMYMTYKPAVTGVSGVSTGAPSSIVISGSFLSLTRSNTTNCVVSILIDTIPCTSPSNPDASSIKCTAPALTGSHTLVLTIDGKASDPFTIAAPLPTIASIQQTSPTMVITGTNFGTVAANVVITLGTLTIIPTIVSDLKITATLPATATNGALTVTVGGQVSNVLFMTIKPIVNGLSGVATGAPSNIIISGSFLSIIRSNSSNCVVSIMIDSTPCTNPSNPDATSLQCTAPALIGAHSLVVTIDGKASDGFTFGAPLPTVASVQQTGATIVITGTNYGTASAYASISFGTLTIIPSSVTDTKITATLPAASTNGPLSVTVAAQVSNSVFVTIKPIVLGVSGVSTGASSSILISGSYLSIIRSNSSSCVVSIMIDSTPCTSPSNPDALSLRCTAPALTGSHSLVVTIDGKASDAFTFAAPTPTVVSVGQTVDTISISGTNYGTVAGNVVITLGSMTITPSSVTDTKITATLPATATNGPLKVTVSGTPSNSITMSITPIFVSANAVPTDGGALVITGKFLNSVDSANNPLTQTVTVGASNTPCTGAAITQGNTQLTCTAPAGVGMNTAITITIGPKSTTGTFNYLAPSITNVVQSTTTAQITVTGTNFGQQATSIGVFINGATVQASAFTVTYTQIVATIPTSSKSDDVYVIVGGQSSNTQFLGLTPILSTVGQPPAIGGMISIVGIFMQSTDFFKNTFVPSVTIDTNIACTSAAFTGSSGTIVTCLAPAGTGVGHTAVVSINSKASNPATFAYQAPSIISVNQNLKAITVTGVNFGTDASKVSVVFGTSGSNFPTSITDNQIVVNIPKDALNGGVNVVVDTQPSATTIPFDLTPIINTVSSVPITGGEITITGYFLTTARQNTDPTTKSVTLLPSTPCTNVNKIVDDNNQARFTCTLPSGTGAPTLRVTIDSKSTDTTVFAYGQPTIDSVVVDATNLITVTGTNLIAAGVTTSIKYGATKIMSYSVSSDSTTISFQAPAHALADFVYITIGSTTLKYLTPLYPILDSVTPSQTIGSQVTLTGTYLNSFNADSTQTTMTVTINGVSCAITADTLTTTNYLPPSMSGLIEQNGQTITVNGDNFGASTDDVTAPTGMTCTSATHTSVVFSIPAVYQSQSISITVGGQSVSGIFVVTPIVNDVAAIHADGGDVVISGSYLNSQMANGTATTMAITLGPMNCALKYAAQDGSSLTCTLGSRSIFEGAISVSIDNKVASTVSTYSSLPPTVSYASSVPPTGGQVTIQGTHIVSPFTVTVAGLPCANGVLTGTTTIVCSLSSGVVSAQMITEALPVVVSNDQISATAKVFLYSRYNCDSQCVNGATCQDGYCVCPTGFSGPTCAEAVDSIVQPSLDPSKVTFQVASLVSFTSQIAYIQEYDNNANQVVSIITIIGASWSESAPSTYNATVQGVSIQVKTDFFNSASDVEYAGETIPVPAGGVKHTVAISGWEFTSQANVLRVIYESQTPSTFNYNCSTASTSLVPFDNVNMPVSFTLDSPVGFIHSLCNCRTIIHQYSSL
ncbi:hypothetical protein SAMD00019534_043330 [Acytostelium subglobosum LB1]|uniref:hypothetical protein n=1 Tax=Acytostelium subglobosum LB1 TaxID=1410327 RepID=UPI0006448B7C|nr:hypothetical protein SAMD00019534_043330 [Acytostelium subglobosum LB1]GAM21158.1 hypothetical protein SAMD00019534_043330 [Acytostelium subglobosum LB1]|eukprot:XP_012756292.1 hypothetical protein SAMD00019534_043330 [Acytostelium subglobosum LB1]